MEEQMVESIENPVDAIEFAVSVNRKDLAQEMLSEVDDVEERLYLADRYDLELDECDLRYEARELAHYIGGMPWGGVA